MKTLAIFVIVFPFVSASLCFLVRSQVFRPFIILVTGALLTACAWALIPLTPFSFAVGQILQIDLSRIILVCDFLLLFFILYLGIQHRSNVVAILALFQIAAVAFLELFLVRGTVSQAEIHCDPLSLVMVLIISTVGSIICFQAIPYMRNHEKHLGLATSRQPLFFLVMLVFLGAMNGLVLSNDMLFIYFFFETTTLCSFLLIAHDRTATAINNALRALWMNSIGGAAFVVALIGLYLRMGSLDLQLLILEASPGDRVFLLSLALLCLAAFTKSAQFPFQSWLLGAMVAPTPVSALLHSSTMVKVGVYLVLRLAPAFKGTFLSQSLACYGAFTFLAAAALAVGQSNGKKVLAYSTISNLGLIFACAGLNSAQALAAAILLILFHAMIKALLFLCVGNIEQHIASRDIEDMRGLYANMPLTALITVMGVIMMIMPPFGILLSKWMVMEAAAANFFIIIMIAPGSALTVMYWSRWGGILMSDPFAGRFKPERQPWLTWTALGLLSAGAGVLSLGAPWLYTWTIVPTTAEYYLPPYQAHGGILENAIGAFAVFPLGIVALCGFLVSIWAVKKAAAGRIVPPYLSGLQTSTPGVFTGPLNEPVRAEAKNYYLATIFGEQKLSTWINLAAMVLLTLIIGGTL